jgi:hypothetical protein
MPIKFSTEFDSNVTRLGIDAEHNQRNSPTTVSLDVHFARKLDWETITAPVSFQAGLKEGGGWGRRL